MPIGCILDLDGKTIFLKISILFAGLGEIKLGLSQKSPSSCELALAVPKGVKVAE